MAKELLENGRKLIAALVALVCVNVLAAIELVGQLPSDDFIELAKQLDTGAAWFVAARWVWHRNGDEAPARRRSRNG